MSKRVFVMAHPQARINAEAAVRQAPEGYCVTVAEPTRNLEQNAAQWPILDAFSKQLQWPVNGQMVYMSPEEWKDVLTAAFERESVRLAMAIDGPGVVMLGTRTSQMGKRKFSEWLEFLHATATARGVVVYEDERRAA
ncbi:MAG TPA: recombination protein NinB [Prosthecobacter sp.]|nr:recombination protein NinB [Prosthecobacter sp.]